ncbi:MAG: preprotein translocase subunit SecE [Patescibacteria group bacterium]|nr:preprotein translocase subunit SecE [Patescibacteria group bacterium]
MKRNPITSFLKESFGELKKVVWPKRSEVIKKTLIVIISMIVIAALIGALDYGLSAGIEVLINLK